MKVLLSRETDPRALEKSNFGTTRIVQWLKALPFILNHRGVLVHRIRYARTYVKKSTGQRTHDAYTYWCGASTTSDSVDFFQVPPESRILCENCERLATAKGHPSADQLAGKHVHVGRMKPKRTCCNDNRN